MNRYVVPKIFGQEIGVILETENGIQFQYSDAFDGERLQISPVMLPYDPHRVYGKYDSMAFDGLPGIFNDSLPDSFGALLMNQYFADKYGGATSLSPIDKLLYVGTNGMGAIEYYPAYEDMASSGLLLRDYIEATRHVLSGESSDVLKEASRHPSPGGARPKAAVQWDRGKNLMVVGGVQADENNMEEWIVKFDEEGKETTKIEYCYMSLAKEVGINIPSIALIPSESECHFAIKRFDRKADGSKLHLATLSGLLHINHNNYHVSTSYEHCIKIGTGITQEWETAKEIFRRMVFNVIGRNCDDHAKNISFLMDENGNWTLSPAYDIVYNFGKATFGQHRMSVAGKTEEITVHDLAECGYAAGLESDFMKEIIGQTSDLFTNIEKRLIENGVSKKTASEISQNVKLFSTDNFPTNRRRTVGNPTQNRSRKRKR